jgi:uncharacterized membrane protein (UPF0127 family)
MILRAVTAAVLAVAMLGGCKDNAGQGGTATTEQGAERLPLSIRTAAGVRTFRVEVARTEAEQAKGLMYRTALPDDGGMLFPSAESAPRSYWMKNTAIPLDIIFIRSDGSIARIAEETVPYSLDRVESGEPVTAVLEIAGGRAAALGIAEGDQVSWTDGAAAK